MLEILKFLKQSELQNETDKDLNEYVDAFTAMGGDPDQSGYVSKIKLINVIKAEFELTIDMEAFLKTIGGDSDDMTYYEFCIMLDHGTGGNPSRISSYLSQNKGSSFMRFSYFVNNIDKL